MALLGLVLLVGLTRYLGLTGLITATRPPQTQFIALALLALAALFVFLIRWPRKTLLGAGILLLIALLVVLKLPALTLWLPLDLRALAGQSVSSAAATDLRWLGFSLYCLPPDPHPARPPDRALPGGQPAANT